MKIGSRTLNIYGRKSTGVAFSKYSKRRFAQTNLLPKSELNVSVSITYPSRQTSLPSDQNIRTHPPPTAHTVPTLPEGAYIGHTLPVNSEASLSNCGLLRSNFRTTSVTPTPTFKKYADYPSQIQPVNLGPPA